MAGAKTIFSRTAKIMRRPSSPVTTFLVTLMRRNGDTGSIFFFLIFSRLRSVFFFFFCLRMIGETGNRRLNPAERYGEIGDASATTAFAIFRRFSRSTAWRRCYPPSRRGTKTTISNNDDNHYEHGGHR